jgi:Arc/MetJ-type ribon-helix-helix transcriptional regulator
VNKEQNDDALDRLAANEPEYASDAATVREALERLREERDAADSQVEHFKRLWVTVEAWVRQLREDTRRLTAELKLAREGPQGTPNGVDRLAQIAERPIAKIPYSKDGTYIALTVEERDTLVAIAKAASEGLRETKAALDRERGGGSPLTHKEYLALHERVRALLSANPPQGDAADFCEHGYTTEDSAHPSAGLERCPTCSPSDGGGAK